MSARRSSGTPRYGHHRIRTVEGPNGTLHLHRPLAGIMLTQAVGRLDDAQASAYTRVGTSLLQAAERGTKGGLWVFNDWDLMTGYTSAARIALTKWALRTFERGDHAVFLLRSPLVSMGVSTASVALSFAGIDVSVEKGASAFETRLKEAIRQRSAGSSSPPTGR